MTERKRVNIFGMKLEPQMSQSEFGWEDPLRGNFHAKNNVKDVVGPNRGFLLNFGSDHLPTS